jgi:plasmid stability protein
MTNVSQIETPEIQIRTSLPEDIHTRLRMSAAQKKVTMAERIVQILDEALPRYEE